MKSIKKILAVILALALVFALAACSTNRTTDSEKVDLETTSSTYTGEKIKVGAIAGPTGMGMVNLFDDKDVFSMNLITDPTTIPGLLTGGDVDITACPLNMASALYNKTNGNIRMLGIVTLGVLYIVTTKPDIQTLADLEGKTIYSSGEGTTAEYILSFILSENGLADKVKVEFLSEHSEVSTKLVSGDIDIAVLPEPFVSIATNSNGSAKAVISLTDEWKNAAPDTELAMGCVITTAKFAEENPDAVKQFIASSKDSVEYVNIKPLEALTAITEKGILPAKVVSTADNADEINKGTVDRCNIVFVDGEEMKKIADANFNVYFNADPTAIGGKLPGADLYYTAG